MLRRTYKQGSADGGEGKDMVPEPPLIDVIMFGLGLASGQFIAT